MFEESYDDVESTPPEVRHLYKDVDGKMILISAGEIKTVADVARVQEGLRKEREDHKATKVSLSLFGELDPTDIHAKLDRISELEAAAGGKIDETKIAEIVESRIKAKTSPLERQIDTLTTERDESNAQVKQYKGTEVRRKIHDSIRTAGTAIKMRDTAFEDAYLLGERIFEIDETGNVVTKDGVGVTPGVDATVWLTEVKAAKQHWWPESQGAGATGGTGRGGMADNPFSEKHWNLTDQGAMIKEDRTRAEQMARAAGTVIGGARPKKS